MEQIEYEKEYGLYITHWIRKSMSLCRLKREKYNKIPLGNKKKQSVETYNNKDESQNQAEWKNPDKKEYISYDSMYKKF